MTGSESPFDKYRISEISAVVLQTTYQDLFLMSPNALQISESSRPFSVTSERAMASLWQKADTLSEGLVTEDGRRFKVKYPGRANARAGPDFHDAILIPS